MTDASSGEERCTNISPTLDESDPELYYEEDEEEDEDEESANYSVLRSILSEEKESDDADIRSILSEDSIYPFYEPDLSDEDTDTDLTLYCCCVKNNAKVLQKKLDNGVTREEVMELDINGRNGLIAACYKGFVDIVIILSKCPFINVNHQDNDGNTALMIAAQAGFTTIVNYLLNYYPALEIETQDVRGLTALMKAAMQGQNDCVSALLMAGADLKAVDPVKRKTAQEWALLTGRFETIVRIRTLLQRPRAEQFSNKYLPEWPALPGLVAQELEKSGAECLSEKIRAMFTIRFPHDPEPDGVLDHMVRMTTCLASPFVATACRTICPENTPKVGKHRLSVPEILNEYIPDPDAKSMASRSSCSSQLMTPNWVLVPYKPHSTIVKLLSLPFRLHRNIVYPGSIPKIRLTKAPAQRSEKPPEPPTPSQNTLTLPRWRYQELREARKKAEEPVVKPKKKCNKKKREGKPRKP
ncbi:photoreceptor ankyrin repeat protein [Heteronotia binoei]|uniref:photoreceptor ankyrin repeat protein n=1 Tax=Heteronotia binoei TaxID=13085 RepID=UPI00292F1C85|nr:photoreceptor ankyrin repeat protein [Heteronotia binoei]